MHCIIFFSITETRNATTQTNLVHDDMEFYSILEQETVTSKKKLNAQRVRTNRLKKKLMNCESLLSELQEQQLADQDLFRAIREKFKQSDVNLLDNELKNKTCSPEARRYSPDIKIFASTVYYHSPAAYRYLRRYLTLPNEVTLRRWLANINGLPGFTTTSLTIIKDRIGTQDIEPDCVLICDSMSIRKQMLYDDRAGQYIGYVDIGDGNEDVRLAGEALVLLASGLKTKWRYPIGYFLVGE